MKKALFLLADGFEEVEAITPMDALIRSGIQVITCGVTGKEVHSTHGLTIVCDETLSSLQGDFDLIYLPGGMPGSTNLKKSEKVCELLQEHHQKNRLIAAICASPAVVLGPLGLLEGKKATCYPGCESFYPSFSFEQDGVVVSDNIITAKSAGWAWEMGFTLIKELVDDEASALVMNEVYYQLGS